MLNISNAKDLENAIGFMRYYGFSPSIKLFPQKTPKEMDSLNIAIFESKDLRHIWRLWVDNGQDDIPQIINVYWKESNINNII